MKTMISKTLGAFLPLSLFALLLLTACSSDDDDSNFTFTSASEAPQWKVDFSGDLKQPEWVSADQSQYENAMYVLVKLQDELVPYSTDDDLMAAFIEGECRSIVAHRSVHADGGIYFALKIMGNNTVKEEFNLYYYSGGLHQLFAINGKEMFVADKVYGIEEDFVPNFTMLCNKYPFISSLDTGELMLPVETTDGDLIGAFVGDECRGVCKPGDYMTLYAYQPVEEADLRFYSAKQKRIYTFKEKVTINNKTAEQ